MKPARSLNVSSGGNPPYTVAAAAAKVNRKQQRWMDRKNNKLKKAFRRPDIGDLKHELSTLDIYRQTNMSTQHHILSH
jgi:hypothetical protein